jgi:D-alanine-D-alanine ligase
MLGGATHQPAPTLDESRQSTVALLAEANHHDSLDTAASLARVFRERGHPAVILRTGPTLAAELRLVAPVLVVSCIWAPTLRRGEVESMLESLGVPFLGSGSEAAALVAQRFLLKGALRAAGVPAPPAIQVTNASQFKLGFTREQLIAAASHLGGPLIVRPSPSSGGIGVRLLESNDALGIQLANTLPALLKDAPSYIVERFVEGTHVSALLAGSGTAPRLLALGSTYDLRLRDRSHPLCDIHFEPVEDAGIRTACEASAYGAIAAVGARDFAIVDLAVDDAGVAWVIDVETRINFAYGEKTQQLVELSGLTVEQVVELMLGDRLAPPPARALEAA